MSAREVVSERIRIPSAGECASRPNTQRVEDLGFLEAGHPRKRWQIPPDPGWSAGSPAGIFDLLQFPQSPISSPHCGVPSARPRVRASGEPVYLGLGAKEDKGSRRRHVWKVCASPKLAD